REGRVWIASEERLRGHLGSHERAAVRVSEPVRDPDVALAVDIHAASAPAAAEFLHFRGIRCGKARDVSGNRVAYPDAILLIDGEMERSDERLAWLDLAAFADNLTFRVITAGEEQKLALRNAQCPDVAAGRDDYPLHKTEPSAKSDPLGRRQRLAVLV